MLPAFADGPVDRLCEACLSAEEALQARHARVARAEKTGIPAEHWEVGFADLLERGFPGEPVLAAQAWATDGGGMFLYGPTGTGKTTIAAAAAWDRALHRPVRWVPARAFGLWTMADFKSPELQLARSVAGGRGALVYDDLGREGTPSAAPFVATMLENRMEAHAPLIVTSNLSLDELADRDIEGQRLASRLARYCRQYVLDGPDHRLDHLP